MGPRVAEVPIRRRKSPISPDIARCQATEWGLAGRQMNCMERPPPSPLTDATDLSFAGFVLDLDRRVLLEPDGSPAELRPQVYEVLELLARHAGQVVSKAELIDVVWPGLVVTDDSLVQAISDLRRALGNAGHDVIRTVPRKGYVLVAGARPSVTPARANGTEEAESPELPPEPASPVDARRSFAFRWKSVSLAGLVVVVAVGVRYFLADVSTPAKPAAPSIAVLAFTDLSKDAEGAALGRAIAGDLVSELARSPELRVISSQSSFQLNAAETPLAEIGRRLRSRYIVDGSLQREGESLRLKVALLDSQGGQVLWTATPVVDRLTLETTERDLMSRVAGILQSRVTRTEEGRARAQPPNSLEVVALTARAKSMFQRYDAQGIRESRRLLGQALALDANYAPAWAYLGITNVIDAGLHLTGEWDNSRGDEFLTQIRRAISLQPDLPVAYVGLSDAQGDLGDFGAALAAGEHCHALSPNDAACFYAIGTAQLKLGQAPAALHNLEEALERNPLPPANQLAFYGTALWENRKFEDAIRVAGDCLAKAPDFWVCRLNRVISLVELGRVSEAKEEAARLRRQVPGLIAENFQPVLASNKEGAELRDRRIAAAVLAGLAPASAATAAHVHGETLRQR
jgi:DNA-binding winged helix-turn-helix (wHTH) protein/TolB-like protein